MLKYEDVWGAGGQEGRDFGIMKPSQSRGLTHGA